MKLHDYAIRDAFERWDWTKVLEIMDEAFNAKGIICCSKNKISFSLCKGVWLPGIYSKTYWKGIDVRLPGKMYCWHDKWGFDSWQRHGINPGTVFTLTPDIVDKFCKKNI